MVSWVENSLLGFSHRTNLLSLFGIQIGHLKVCVYGAELVYEGVSVDMTCICAFICACYEKTQRGKLFKLCVSQFEYTLCTYQMRAQMRWLVNICFSIQPFSARAASGEKRRPRCLNLVFHLSASSLNLKNTKEHCEDKMPCQAISSSPLAFHIEGFTLSSKCLSPR